MYSKEIFSEKEMKKKIIAVILSIILLLPLSSCHKHDWMVWPLEYQTCLTRGAERHECRTCGKAYTKYLPAIGGNHDFVETIVEPTCKNIGLSRYTCSRCGYYFEDDYTPVVHTYENGQCTLCGGHKEGSDGLKFIKTNIGYSVADYVGTDENVIIPTEHEGETVFGIEDYAFFGNTNIESVEIPLAVSAVGVSAFENCTSLKSITLTDGAASIGHRAFYNCTSLKEIDFTSVASIGDSAFYNCTSLKEAVFGENLSYLGDYSFYNCKKLQKATIFDLVSKIHDYTFYGCTSLKYVSIGKLCHDIGKAAFAHCSSLQYVQFGEGLEDIAVMAFYNCSSLKEVRFEKNMLGIAPKAFSGCSSLKSAVFADAEKWEFRKDKQTSGERADLSDFEENARMLSDKYSEYYLVKDKESEKSA